MRHFWIQDGPFAPNNFFPKSIIILIYLLGLFIVENLKKASSSRSRVMNMCNFGAQNDPFPRIIFFSETLLMSLTSFIHAYLHDKQ